MSYLAATKRQAEYLGRKDAMLGETKDASKYSAKPESAWEKWYLEGYESIGNNYQILAYRQGIVVDKMIITALNHNAAAKWFADNNCSLDYDICNRKIINNDIAQYDIICRYDSYELTVTRLEL